ncbi:MAG: hypothetical protein Q9182_005210 [Xanthomendoza sp. 2 TL-2023]
MADVNPSSGDGNTSVYPPHPSDIPAQHQTDLIDPSFRVPPPNEQSPILQQPQQTQDDHPQSLHDHPSPDTGKKKGGQGPRLRKACDACSKRKVKIPCQFTRPTKRRGPRNRAADAIRDELLTGAPRDRHSGPSSPTYAARTLASLAQRPVLSAESICPAPLLARFVDDYFNLIHPLMPIPHEPSFRSALAARQDLTSPTFLALLASMIGCLVASIPRRPRQHILDLQMEAQFPNSGILIERCHVMAIEARGLAYLDRPQTVEDSMISLLQGLIGAYSWRWDACRLYLGQCVTISKVVGLHRRDVPGSEPFVNAANAAAANAVASGNSREGTIPPQKTDVVLQELCKRTFWIIFSTVTSLQQLGLSARELSIPPPTALEPYPDLPLEVDDEHITAQGTRPMAEGEISRMVGFNATMSVYKACIDISTMDAAYGSNELFDWPRQKDFIKRSLASVEGVLGGVPSALLFPNKPPPNEAAQDRSYPPPIQGFISPGAQLPFQSHGSNEQMKTALEIQKANLHAAQLATRSYLLQKYSILSTSFRANNNLPTTETNTSEDAAAIVPSADKDDSTTVDELAEDRDVLTKDLLNLLQNLNLTYIEPDGLSFTNKIRQADHTLISVPADSKSEFLRRVETYLTGLVDFLVDTQRVGPRAEEGVDEEEVRARQWREMLRPMGEFV